MTKRKSFSPEFSEKRSDCSRLRINRRPISPAQRKGDKLLFRLID
jgi:hypothetical protein